MMSRKFPALFLYIPLLLVACKKGPLLDVGEAKDLLNADIQKIEVQKTFNVDPASGLENILFVRGEKFAKIMVVARKKDAADELLWQRDVPNEDLVKLAFLQPGRPESFIMLLTKNSEYTLQVHAPFGKVWEKKLSAALAKKLFIRKGGEKFPDEAVIIGESEYRFNGFEFALYDVEGPLPIITRIAPSDTEGWIEIQNRGSYTARGILTIGFPGLTSGNLKNLALTRDIASVRMYKPGRRVHKKGGGMTSLSYPIIEVVKEPFASGGKIRLPLRLPQDISEITVRMAYTTGGRPGNWPLESKLTIVDGQGYPAYRKVLNSPQ